MQIANDAGKTKHEDVDGELRKNHNLILEVLSFYVQYSQLLTIYKERSRIGAALTAGCADVRKDRTTRGNRG